MEARVEFLANVCRWLEQAQQVANTVYDRGHRVVTFVAGEWVWLWLHHRTATSLDAGANGKLRPCYFGPYKIMEMINPVAARLELPTGARLHDVFHVGLLKKFVGSPPARPPPLPATRHRAVVPTPDRALKVRLCHVVRQVLVQWKDMPPSSASWEDLNHFQESYPSFQLADELLLQGGDVMWGHHYEKRKKDLATTES
jgi:hypothetical protein